jgi:4-amino-4-deoxy-L-arabinose transferase-like glycosyltransferase
MDEGKAEAKTDMPAKKQGILDKTIDFLFSNDERKWLILIFVVGAILRFIVARNIAPIGDEAVHGPHAIGILHSGLISTIAHAPLWFYLTDVFYNILGVTMLSARFLSFFYGSLSILLIYLIASKIFSKKVGLISAFCFSVSYFIIRYTLAEMDLSALFFLLLAFYIFMIDMDKDKFPWLAAISIGMASLFKTISLYFVPVFIIGFFLLSKKKEPYSKKEHLKSNLKKIFLFGFIVLLFFSPILIHNYLWYKDKGMVDIYFAEYFNVEKARAAYSGLQGFDAGFMYFITGLPTKLPVLMGTIFDLDPLILILGFLGIIFFLFNKNEKNRKANLLLLFELIGYLFLIVSTGLQTHFTIMMPVLCIFSGYFLSYISEKIKIRNLSPKRLLMLLLAIIFIFQIYMLWPHFSESGVSQLREYAIDNMQKDSLVVVDARTYRGRIALMFNDFHYLESSYFNDLIEMDKNLSGTSIPVRAYFVECTVTDCGWGTIKDQPEFNKSVSQLFDMVKNVSSPKKIIYGGGGFDDASGGPYFTVYEVTINLHPQAFSIVDSTHTWFYYPVNYVPKEQIFDQYEVKGFLDNLIYKFAWFILILSIVLALISPALVIFYSYKNL